MTRTPSHISQTTVFVRGLEVHAEIGVYDHEQGRTQSLLVDIEVTVETGGWRHLVDTVNYEALAAHAERIATGGHIGLVESFAERLAEACLSEPRVTAAGVEIVARKS